METTGADEPAGAHASAASGVPPSIVRLGGIAWRLVAIAAALWVLGTAFKRLELVFVPVTVALFFTTVLRPAVLWLGRHGWSRALATWAVFLGTIALVAGLVILVAPELNREFRNLGSELNRASDEIRDRLSRSPFNVKPEDFDRYVTDVKNQLTANRNRIVDDITASAELVLRTVAAGFLAAVLTFFFLKDGERMVDWLLETMPARHAGELREIGEKAWATLTGYVRGTAINGIVNAAVIGTGLAVLRVPLVVPIVVVTALSAFVPVLGAIVSGAVAALVALVTRGTGAALVVVALTVVVHHLEGYLVGPFVLGRRVKLHPVVVLVSLSVGSVLGGILGAFYAVPIVAIAASIHAHRRARHADLVVVSREPAD